MYDTYLLTLRRGVTHTPFDIEEIIDSFDRELFSKITHPGQLTPSTPS